MARYAKVEYTAWWVYPYGESSDVVCTGSLSEVKRECKYRTLDDHDTIHIYKDCYIKNEDYKKYGNKYDEFDLAVSILIGKVEFGKFTAIK